MSIMVAGEEGFTTPDNISITRRELGALVLVARGYDNKEAASKMGVKETTLRNHIYNLMKKLGAKNRSHAVVKAVELGLLTIGKNISLRELSPEEYVLCWVCKRAYLKREAAEIEQVPFTVNHVTYNPPTKLVCPYEGCNATMNDTWVWNEIREMHPEYSKIPEKGVVYPHA
ncbi:LuxR C-terminal-related transcriptional regulator [Chloroflexota bacterium]